MIYLFIYFLFFVYTVKINGVQSIGLDENSTNILQNIIICVLQKKKVECQTDL